MDEAGHNIAVEPAAQPSQPTPLDNPEERSRVARLIIRSLPQLLVFNGAISLSVALLLAVLDYATHVLLSSVGTALTTANATQVLFSWQGVLLAIITTVIVTAYVAVDVFAHIYVCAGLLTGEPGSFFKRAARSINRAIKSLSRFGTFAGVLIFIYIIVLSPLTGVGFSTGLTRDLYVPHFIMSVIESTPVLHVTYIVAILALVVVGVVHIFAIFDVLLDGASPKLALRQSRRLVRTNFKGLANAALKLMFAIGLLIAVAFIVYMVAEAALLVLGDNYMPGEEGALVYLSKDLDPTSESIAVSIYRSLCFFVSIIALGVVTIGGLLAASSAVMYATHLYHWYSEGQPEEPRYILPSRRRRRWATALRTILVIIAVGLVSLICGFSADYWMHLYEPVQVVAHRLGGDGAPENSLEGLEFAIAQGCYGAETDIQRTKDGRYVINHDDNFSRLCGNDAKVQDLTFEEVEQLRIHDPLYPDTESSVLTFEEVLDAAKGRIKLFVELKGDTADHQMVDDAVRIVREHDAEDDVVFISLKYDCIEYGKQTYPEFDYGLLIFAGFGDMELLQCDIVLTEEEMTTDDFIEGVHEANKELGVWTANTEEDLRKVLYSEADYVITDKVVFAREVQESLDKRTDSELIQDIVWR